jgi:hypothetical protein
MTDAQVCGEYGDEAREYRKWGMGGHSGTFLQGARVDGVVSEIKRRDLLSDSHGSQVLSGHVEIGMTEVEALCAWGNPTTVGLPAPDRAVIWTYDTNAFALAMPGTVSLTILSGKVKSVQR